MKQLKPFWENKTLNGILDFLQKLVFAIGIPLSILTYIFDVQKDREEHEFFVYDSMDKKYWEYEMFASRYPQLGLSDAVVADSVLQRAIKPDSLLTTDEKVIARQLCYLLISMYERAYLLYATSDKKQRKDEWKGWEDDLKNWMKIRRLRALWDRHGNDFDERFEAYVNSILEQTENDNNFDK